MNHARPARLSSRPSLHFRGGGLLRALFCIAIAFINSITTNAHAQILRGDWVDAADKSIEKSRKVALRVLVLDKAGKPTPGVEVRLEQLRHAFAWGVPASALPELKVDAPPRSPDVMLASVQSWPAPAPVWRCFSAVSLESLTTPYRAGKPTADADAALRSRVDSCNDRLIPTRWGGVLSADAGRLPGELATSKGEPLARLLSASIDRSLRAGRGVRDFDLYTHSVDHDFIESKLGSGAVRKLYEQAKLASPNSTLTLRFEDCLQGERLQTMIRRMIDMREAMVPVDALAIDARFSGNVLQAPLSKSLDWIGGLKMPVSLVQFEVGGPSPAQAAINLEMVLRLAYAEPCVQGIWFAGVKGDQLTDATAALLEADGSPTPAGDVFDRLVHGLWWSDVRANTDSLGYARGRVFAGHYRVSATLSDGSVAESLVSLPLGAQGEKDVVIQPFVGDAKPR